jgi:hypothetical protein
MSSTEMLRDAADRGFFRFAALLGHTRERTNLRSQTMSGILRAAAPLARRLNAVPKGPIAQQTRGMACECPERRAVSHLPPSHPGLDYRLVR